VRRRRGRSTVVRRVAAGVVLAGLAAWIAVGAFMARAPSSASARTTSGTALQLRRVQHAAFVPARETGDPIFILAIGSDARPGVCMPVERCLADSIHLIGINPKRHAATILGFPRDSYVEIPGFGTAKINNALFHGGPELVVRTVEHLTGIRIDYYLLTSFSEFVGMVDLIGGLEVKIPYSISGSGNLPGFQAGLRKLDGQQALALARNRKGTPNGDFSRSENQGLILLAALAKLRAEFAQDPSTMFRWIAAGSARVTSDLSLDEMFELMLTAQTITTEKVHNLVVPGGAGYAGTASVVFLGSSADRIFTDMRKDGLA
jgi:polyisoprenyl-teichoic acid--peptidoglycan teichoic acid transferase